MSATGDYVEFGFRSSYPGPFQCRDADMQMLVLQGHAERIESLVRRTLTEPAGGAVEYRPLGGRVILLYGYNLVRSGEPPWDGYGAVAETLASFWVPVWAGHSRAGRFHAERLCMTIPFLLVDNPMSLVTGREVYGFSKALGRFTTEGERLLIEGYGGPHDATAVAGWHDLLELAPVGDESRAEAKPLGGSAELTHALARELIDGYEQESLEQPGGVQLTEELCGLTRQGNGNLVFLKQFRDAAAQSRACYRAVVEAPARTLHISANRPLREWDLTVHSLDSHPIVDELGVRSQRSRWSAHLDEFAFDVLAGEVVGPIVGPPDQVAADA